MKRFIDLRGADIFGIDSQAIAYYDTVRDVFETHSGAMAWDNFPDFASDYEGDDLEKYRNITPSWALETIDLEVLSSEVIDTQVLLPHKLGCPQNRHDLCCQKTITL